MEGRQYEQGVRRDNGMKEGIRKRGGSPVCPVCQTCFTLLNGCACVCAFSKNSI